MRKANLAMFMLLFSFFFTGMCIINATYTGIVNNPYVGQFRDTNLQFYIRLTDPVLSTSQPQIFAGIQAITGFGVRSPSKALKKYRFICGFVSERDISCTFQMDLQTSWTSMKYRVYIIGTDASQDNHNLRLGFTQSQIIYPGQNQALSFSLPQPGWVGTIDPSAYYKFYPFVASVQQSRKGSLPLDVTLENPIFDPILGLASVIINSNAQYPFKIQLSYAIAAISVPQVPTYFNKDVPQEPKVKVSGPRRTNFKPTQFLFNSTDNDTYFDRYNVAGMYFDYAPLWVETNLFRHLQVQRQCDGIKRKLVEYTYQIQFDDNTVADLTLEEYKRVAAAYDYSQGNTKGLFVQTIKHGLYQSSQNNQTLSISDLSNIAQQLTEKEKEVVVSMIKKVKFAVKANEEIVSKCVQCSQDQVFVVSVGQCKSKTTTLRQLLYPLFEDKNYVVLNNPGSCLIENQATKKRMTELDNNRWLMQVGITVGQLAVCNV